MGNCPQSGNPSLEVWRRKTVLLCFWPFDVFLSFFLFVFSSFLRQGLAHQPSQPENNCGLPAGLELMAILPCQPLNARLHNWPFLLLNVHYFMGYSSDLKLLSGSIVQEYMKWFRIKRHFYKILYLFLRKTVTSKIAFWIVC